MTLSAPAAKMLERLFTESLGNPDKADELLKELTVNDHAEEIRQFLLGFEYFKNPQCPFFRG